MGKRRRKRKRSKPLQKESSNPEKPAIKDHVIQKSAVESGILIAVLLTIASLCIGTLLATTSPMSRVRVSILAVLGALSLGLLIFPLRLYKLGIPGSRPFKIIVMCLPILIGMGLLGWTAWPRITISPGQVKFAGYQASETYTLRLANETPNDQYRVEVLFTLPHNSDGFNDPEIYVPLSSRKPAFDGSVMSDIFVLRCYENDGTPDEYLIFHRLTPNEQREIKVRRKVKSEAKVHADIASYSSTPLPQGERKDTKEDPTQQLTSSFVAIRACQGVNEATKPHALSLFMNDDEEWKWSGAKK